MRPEARTGANVAVRSPLIRGRRVGELRSETDRLVARFASSSRCSADAAARSDSSAPSRADHSAHLLRI